jgi:hypothetical protein
MNYNDLINKIYQKTIENQFYVVNIEGKEPVTGYTVSTIGNELRIKLSDFTPEKIDKYIKTKLLRYPYAYFGTWILDDTVYIDVLYYTECKAIAIEAGKMFGQVCIWDISSKQEIYWLSEALFEYSLN